MNESTQKRQIQRFLNGNDKRDVDAFSIYQWIERCQNNEWWDMAIKLSSYITPGVLSTDYQRRLDFILKDCRLKQDNLYKVKQYDPIPNPLLANRKPVRKIIRDSKSSSGSYKSNEGIPFENDAKETLRQIYSVLYYMTKNYDFAAAVSRTKDKFQVLHQTVDDKCGRRFAGNVEVFQRWYRNGEILQKLKSYFHLSYHDYKIFEEMLTRK